MTAISGSFTTLMRMIAALKRLFHTLTKLINTSSHLNTLLHSISAPPLLPLQLCLHPLTFHLLSSLIFSSFFLPFSLFILLSYCHLSPLFPPLLLSHHFSSHYLHSLPLFVLFVSCHFLFVLSLPVSLSLPYYLCPLPPLFCN